MKNYAWIVATAQEDGKNFSYAMRLNDGLELKCQLKHVDHAHLCGTKKEAYALAELWNKCYKDNGTYMY